MSMTLAEAEIWELRQMAKSPYYATRRTFLNLIADKLEQFEDAKREANVFRSLLDRICDITGDLQHTNENVVVGVKRIKTQRDAAFVGLTWIKEQSCQRLRAVAFGDYDCANHPSRLCLSEYCLPCYAKATLESIIDETPSCRHGIAFDEYCGKCEAAIHANPADSKPRRG
jgi:hypothetical protein